MKKRGGGRSIYTSRESPRLFLTGVCSLPSTEQSCEQKDSELARGLPPRSFQVNFLKGERTPALQLLNDSTVQHTIIERTTCDLYIVYNLPSSRYSLVVQAIGRIMYLIPP